MPIGPRLVLLLTVACVAVVAEAGLVTPPQTAVAAEVASVSCDTPSPTAVTSGPLLESFEPKAPARVVDTRVGTGGVTGPIEGGCSLRLDTTEFLASDATAVALSLTVVSTEPGFFTVFGCADGLPETSNVNARTGTPTANLVIGVPDEYGEICIFASAGGHVIVDTTGWWSPGANSFHTIDPERVTDTRSAEPAGRLEPGVVRPIDLANTVVPADAVAVAVNVAAVGADDAGFIVTYPCGSSPPLASNLNFRAGENRASSTIVQIGADARVCVLSSAATDVLVDVTGFYAPSGSGPSVALSTITDTRVVDTRRPSGPAARFVANSWQRYDVAALIPAERASTVTDSVAVALNVVAVRADEHGFLSVGPCGAGPNAPTTSSLNYDLGQTSNLVLTKLSVDGAICVFASTGVDVAIDLVGAVSGTDDLLVDQLSFTRRSDGLLVDLLQDFDGGSDYTLPCTSDGLDVDLRLGVARGTVALVDGTSVGSEQIDIALDLALEGLVAIELERGDVREEYFVRCLPPDFPTFEVTRFGTVPAGWYTTNLGWNEPAFGKFLVILDHRGVPVWFKRTGPLTIDLKRLSTGDLVAAPVLTPGFGVLPEAGHHVMGLDGIVTDVLVNVDPEEFPTDFHDYFEITGAGDGFARAVISYPLVLNQDLTVLGAGFGSDEAIVDGVIQEIDADGSLLWDWRASDHFGYDEVTFPNRFGFYPEDEVDVFHLNSIDRADDGSGDYVVSARHLDAVFRVDRATADVEWIVSSTSTAAPNKSDAQRLTIVGDPFGGPLRMHDARVDGDLLTMYDNRSGNLDGEPARFVEYRIDAADGTATMTRQILQPAGVQSLALGGARVTGDGTVVVSWSQTQPMFGEFTADGTELMRVTMEPSDFSYRIVKYGVDDFDADELRATAGGSVEVPS